MRKLIFAVISVGWLACGGSQQAAPGPYAPSGSVPGVMDETRPPPAPSGFASRPDCEKLVDHLDSIFMLSGRNQQIFRAPNQRPDWHRSRVDECTIKVDRYDRDCLLGSHDISTAQRCNSKFFADTMQAYRFQ